MKKLLSQGRRSVVEGVLKGLFKNLGKRVGVERASESNPEELEKSSPKAYNACRTLTRSSHMNELSLSPQNKCDESKPQSK